MKKIFFFAVFLMLVYCKSQKVIVVESQTLWHQDNFVKDSLYGNSLNKWILNSKKTKNEIIVAIIDSQIDLNQEDLQGQLWVNEKEIANNGIDDDNNGYIDDLNGWNFIGKPNGGFFRYWNFEYVRIVRNLEEYFIKNDSLSIENHNNFKEYKRAKDKYKSDHKYYTNWLKSIDFLLNKRSKINDTLKYYFPKGDYTIDKLDSLYNLKKINDKSFKQRRDDNDSDIGALIFYMKVSIESESGTLDQLMESKNQLDSLVNRNLNRNYNDRKFIGDNPEKLEKGYGNNRLNVNTFQLGHNTAVSSIIAANRDNSIGTKGFHQNIKIMPLSISASGDEHDKDIAMAIYYAVDNGAKIINMSFGKEFSLKQEWVTEAFKYAEKHNVLLVHGSGNNRFDVDSNPYYPSDIDYLHDSKNELVSNFINVGSISIRTDSTMVSPFSSYGKQNVDLFAPGEDIYIAKPNNEYGYDSGTSLAAPMVSGTAALIWLYYPKLTVQEVKKIILESGVTIDKNVVKPGTKEEMVPFSELSKTGKILNTYNAMKMSEVVSKKRK